MATMTKAKKTPARKPAARPKAEPTPGLDYLNQYAGRMRGRKAEEIRALIKRIIRGMDGVAEPYDDAEKWLAAFLDVMGMLRELDAKAEGI